MILASYSQKNNATFGSGIAIFTCKVYTVPIKDKELLVIFHWVNFSAQKVSYNKDAQAPMKAKPPNGARNENFLSSR